MEMFILREKKLSDFNIYYFQLCFLYISVLRNLYNKVRACVDATSDVQRRDQSITLLVLDFRIHEMYPVNLVNKSMASKKK